MKKNKKTGKGDNAAFKIKLRGKDNAPLEAGKTDRLPAISAASPSTWAHRAIATRHSD